MNRSRLLILAIVLLVFGARVGVTSAANCLDYDPVVVSLSGLLVRITNPGPPNYKSVSEGDASEAYFYLKLQTSICTNAKSDGGTNVALNGVKLVQLNLKPEQYKLLESQLGRTIALSGKLYAAYSGHHHAPLLLSEVATMPSSTSLEGTRER